MIIDAHVHLPVADNLNSLQKQKEQLKKDMKENGVNKCIIISDSETKSTIGSMEECVELFADEQDIFVVAGISPNIHFGEQLIRLQEYLKQKQVIGIKLFTGHEFFYLTDERLEIIYETALQYDVPILFHSGWENSQYSNVSEVMQIAMRHSKMKLVCCHCFYPEIIKCRELFNLKNVFFDLSSIADDGLIWENICEEVKRLIELVPTRVLFGSDYACCNQREHINLMKSLGLEKQIEEALFYKNAQRLYQHLF